MTENPKLPSQLGPNPIQNTTKRPTQVFVINHENTIGPNGPTFWTLATHIQRHLNTPVYVCTDRPIGPYTPLYIYNLLKYIYNRGVNRGPKGGPNAGPSGFRNPSVPARSVFAA